MPEAAECALFCKDFHDHMGQFPDINVQVTKNSKGTKYNIARTELENGGYKFTSRGKLIEVYAAGKITSLRLGMTGRLSEKVPDGYDDHVMVKFTCQKTGKQAFYVDPRRFSAWSEGADEICEVFGYKESHYKGDLKKAEEKLGASWERKPRIAWLLGTGSQTGIGNYMANEILGRLDLNPFEKGRESEVSKVLQLAYEIAAHSFEEGGNSFGGGYYRFDGSVGNYQKYCKFYKNPDINRVMYRGRVVYSRFTPEAGDE